MKLGFDARNMYCFLSDNKTGMTIWKFFFRDTCCCSWHHIDMTKTWGSVCSGCGSRWYWWTSWSRCIHAIASLYVFLVQSILFKRWQNLLSSGWNFNCFGAIVITGPVQKGYTSITQIWVSKSEHFKSSCRCFFDRSETQQVNIPWSLIDQILIIIPAVFT